MKILTLALIVFLTGCAHDNYAIISDSGGSKEAMASDLYNCKIEAVHTYMPSQPSQLSQSSMTGNQIMGIVAAGAIGGAIGGAAFGAVVASQDNKQDNNSMKTAEINPYVEKCMLRKGYNGTSS